MKRALQQSDYFWADLQKQVDWYRDNATTEVAERYIAAVEATLKELVETPGPASLPRLAGIGGPPFLASPQALPPPSDLLPVRRRHAVGGTRSPRSARPAAIA